MTLLFSVAREEDWFGDICLLETHNKPFTYLLIYSKLDEADYVNCLSNNHSSSFKKELQFCLGWLEAQLKNYISQPP